MQHFDRNIAIVFDVMREIHGRHPARAELAVYAIATAKRSSESIDGYSHANGIPIR